MGPRDLARRRRWPSGDAVVRRRPGLCPGHGSVAVPSGDDRRAAGPAVSVPAPVGRVELCCMTVRQASLSELIALAAQEGFDTLTATARLIERADLEPAALRRQCDDAGVAIGYVDGLSSPLPGTPEGVTEERCFALAEG